MNQSESVLESPDMRPSNRAAKPIYLASNSPRRKELLSLIGLEYTLLPVQVDETPLRSERGIDYVQRIARAKAVTSASQAGMYGVVIAADTAVVDPLTKQAPEIMGKPADQDEAREMLKRLRGHVHQVLTAIFILRTQDGKILSDLCATDVPMREYSDGEIETYVASGDPLDKAGAYAIQHRGFHPVAELDGCFANVMGLPLCHLARNLLKFGLSPSKDVPTACLAGLRYYCPIFASILKDPAVIGSIVSNRDALLQTPDN